MSFYVDRPKGLWVCTWFLMYGLVWSGYVWFGLVKFGLVLTDGRTNEQTDLCIELRYAQLIKTNGLDCRVGHV